MSSHSSLYRFLHKKIASVKTLSRLRGKIIELRRGISLISKKKILVWTPTSAGVTKAMANHIQRYFKVPTQTKAKYHFFGVIVASIALAVGLIVGGWQIYKAVFALTETTVTMPADTVFNRGVSGILASYLDDEGKIEVATNSVKLAKVSNWWNENYKYRKQITLKNLSSASISTSSAQITIDTKSLFDAGKLLANCNDLRIAKQASAGASMIEQPRSFTPASGTANCSDSTASIVAFQLNETYAANASSSAYFLYYGNSSATAPSYLKEKYLSFDGVDDKVYFPGGSVNYTAGESPTFSTDFWIKTSTFGYYKAIIGAGSAAWNVIHMPTSTSLQYNTHHSTDGGAVYSWTIDNYSGMWQHFVLIYDKPSGNVKLYQNGEYKGQNVVTKRIERTMAYIGGQTSAGEFFNGQIENVRLFNRAISESEALGLYAGTDVTSGLQVYYKFDDASGQITADSSGNGRNGTLGANSSVASDDPALTNSSLAYSLSSKNATMVCPFNGSTTCTTGQIPTTATGAIRYATGSALTFDGNNDSISLSAISDYSNLSVSMWFKTNVPGVSNYNTYGFSSNLLFQRYITGGCNGGEISLGIVGGKLAAQVNPSECTYSVTSQSSQTVNDNNWHHAVLTVQEQDSMKIYVDGVLAGNSSLAAVNAAMINTIVGSEPAPTLGKMNWWGGSQYFRGSMDEVRVYGRVLSQSDVTNLYANTDFSARETSLTTHYHFDENGDDPRNIGKVIDASGNGNHGTITGAKYINDSPVKNGSYASHEGVFIEEGTTNLITNPSFENTSATLNWNPSAFTYATASATFTPSMAKRNSAGPFAAGPIMQGKLDGSGTGDSFYAITDSSISTLFNKNLDANQGSISFSITPEWNGNDNKQYVLLRDENSSGIRITKTTSNYLDITLYVSTVTVDISNWVAGSTYNVVVRWDTKNPINTTNYVSVSVNDVHTFGVTTAPAGVSVGSRIWLGSYYGNTPANVIIEGLTIYRRVLYDGVYGTNVGNGDEINQIYNAGTGKDPTLVTGSWDVVFALPTNSATGALATGTGNAWSMPHSSNLLGGTNGKNGFMTSGDVATDGLTAFTPNKLTNFNFNSNLDNWSATQSYTLRDEFSDTVAAGSVNGTMASDGVNIRTSDDSGNLLSVGSGALSINQNWPTNSPRLSYPSVTRNLGLAIISKNKTTSTTNNSSWGFSAAQTGATYDDGLSFNSSQNFIPQDTSWPLLGGYSADTYYQNAIVLRSTGSYNFINIDGIWKLMHIDKTGSTSALYPKFSLTNGAIISDYIHIPLSTYIPTPLAYDTFTRADGVIGNSETTGPDGQTTLVNTWTGGAISGNKVVITPSLGSDVLTNGNMESGNPPTGWVGYQDATLSSVADERTGGGGMSSLDIARSITNYPGVNNGFTTIDGVWYSVDAWTKNGSSTGAVRPRLGTNSLLQIAQSSGTWVENIRTGRSVGTSSNINLETQATAGANNSRYDDISVKPLTLSSLFSSISTSDGDVIADANVTLTAGTQAGLVLNLDSATIPANFVIAYHDGTNVKLEKNVSGTYTQLISAAATYSAGATLRVIKDGTKYRVYYNNALVGTEQTISDAGIISNTKHGLFSTYSGNSFDNFSLFARGTGGEYSGIPAEDLIATYDTTTKYAGTGSVKLVAAGNDANFVQSVNVGDTNNYTLSTYAYTTGSAVTSADVELWYDTATLSASFSSVGGGWYQLSGTLTGVASGKQYGVRVKAGKTVYIDNINLQITSTNTSATTLATASKIFAGGYGVSSDQNGGIYRDITVTAGQDLVIRGIAHSDGVSQPKLILYDQTNDVEIGSLTGTTTSTKSAPDTLLFTGEAPSGCTTVRVKMVNAVAASSSVNWHQVEVYNNLATNPSFESGAAADPFIPTGWTGSGLVAGDSNKDTTNLHTGSSSFGGLQANNHYVNFYITGALGKFVNMGGFFKMVSGSESITDPGNNISAQTVLSGAPWNASTANTWTRKDYVGRFRTGSTGAFAVGNGTGLGSIDDVYAVLMDDVSLTVTSATQANSTETSGLRVDGADTLTQPITGLSATNGVIKFKFMPRHSFSVENKFGSECASCTRIAVFYLNANNSIDLTMESSSTIRTTFKNGGVALNADWSSPILNAGTSYQFEIRYSAGGAGVVLVDGIEKARVSGLPATIGVPTTAYFGTTNTGTSPYEGTFSSFVTSSATENSTAPYYKFGSKSIKIQSYDSPDQYVTTATASANAAYTLSAYVYDNTTGNVGGIVDSTVTTLASGSASLTTTYTDVGGGWWRLSHTTATIPAGTYNFGVEVKAGKTIYFDGVQMEQKAYSTTYADGSLGTGHAWVGTVNNSTSTRTISTLKYSISNANYLGGTASIWVKPSFSQSSYPSQRQTFLSIGNYYTNNNIMLKRHDGGILNYGMEAGQSFTNSFGTINKDNWVNLIATWNNGSATFYLNGALQQTISYTAGSFTGSDIWVGSSNDDLGSNSTISDLRIFDQPLSTTEITSLYNQGLMTHQSAAEASDRYAALGTYTSPVLDLGANGQWGGIPIAFSQALNGGTVAYSTRTSADNTAWSSWEAVSVNTIASQPRRYLQWKADMTPSTGATIDSPVISGMTVKYVEDTTPPVNPSAIASGFSTSATGSANLISGEWYNFAHPKFTWDSADDAAANGQSASGIDSYYAFFTQDADATPSANVADDCFRQTTELDRSITVGTTPALCTLADGTYYLRLQSKDNSGNISDPITLFTYRYDGSIPNAPASVSTTSVGYTSNNAFTFFWPSATDNGPSGVKGYEYKTGTSSGAFSDWTFTSGTTATDISAYQEGQNFFLVRTVDNGNNVSGSTSNNVSMASFYYNASAPTQPQNVNISPTTSESAPSAANVFDVTWDKPATYSGEIAKYFYCVNCTPALNVMTETTAAETVNRTLTNIALATQQGKNTFFIVAEDNNLSPDTGHGNRNFDAYISKDFYASTVAPAAPTSLVVSDASDRDALIWRLTLTWKAPATGGTPKIYHVYRAEGTGEYVKLGETTSTAYTDADLTQSIKYSYKVRAVDNAGSLSLFSAIVTRSPEGKYTAPPTAGGVPTSTSGSTTATIKWTTSRTSFGTVEYGKTTDYGSAATETTATKDHMVKVTGLAPGVSYHYRVQSLDDSSMVDYNRVDAYSTDYSFTTLNTASVTGIEITDIGLDSAVVTWKTISLATSKVEYGTTLDYGKSIDVSASASESAHTTRISGLTHSTTYHFRVRGTTSDGDDIYSQDNTFQTTIFPKVTALVMNTDQDAAGTTIVLAWSTNVPTTGEVLYQAAELDPTSSRASGASKTTSEELQKMDQIELAAVPVIPKGSQQIIYSGELLDKHIQRISGLTDGSIYIFTIRGRDEKGNQAISDPIRYVTGADTRPPNLQNVIIETPMTGVGADAKAQIIISWETDEPSTSQVLWGSGTGNEYPQASEKEMALTTKHVVVLRDLLPTSSYHLKIISADKTGNIAESKDTVVVTPSSQQAAFDIIIKNLEDVFGFLKL